ncbi:DUF5050 domain-containing protein [Clostridium oceanicum]|uniref:DUF5050 domain-containing protein n=1 Tax=Clostridium oceanicum TaxID=1543 RepID=A0ABP3UYN8_9CLOT
MKKIISNFLIVIMLASSFVFIPKLVYASGENYRNLATKNNISPSKNWTVKFNRDIDTSSMSKDNIIVYDKVSGEKIDVDISAVTERSIKVKPKSKYLSGKKYIIEVKNIKSKDGEVMKSPAKMEFNVKNLYSGLPMEDGLVILKDKAYSIEYLYKNKSLVNEIINSNGFNIYYVYDYSYQRIRSLFDDKYLDGKTKDFTRSNTMTYIDANGNKHIYKWNETEGEYKLVPPSIDAEIYARGNGRMSSVKINAITSVPDAKYFKLKHSNLIRGVKQTIAYFPPVSYEEVSILSSDKTVLGKAYIYVGETNNQKYSVKLVDNLWEGNSPGNINNNGIAAEDGKRYVYYVNNANNENLYKIGFDDMYNRRITKDKVQYVNVLNDYVYYSNYTDGGKLYKSRTDGSDREKLLDDKAAYVTISGEYIYYSNHSDHGRLYRIKKDGSDAYVDPSGRRHGRQVCTDNDGSKDEVAYINIVGDWIYYSNYSDGHKPYVVNKDGNYRGKICDEWANCVQVEGDWIYYCSGAGIISKVRKTGSGAVVPIKGKVSEFNRGFHINAYGDWIYYSNYDDHGKLYKVKTDGSGTKIKLSDDSVGYINIVGDFIYYTTRDNKKICRLPLNSNGNVKPMEMGKPNNGEEIVRLDNLARTVAYDDVNQPIEWIESKYLPEKVAATMKDNTMQQLVVIWDTKNVKIGQGVRTYTGDVVGYDKKVTMKLTIPSEMINDTNKIMVYNNPGTRDIVEVRDDLTQIRNGDTDYRARFKQGDIINIYADKNKEKRLGTGRYNNNVKMAQVRCDLKPQGEEFYITITRVQDGKAESALTKVEQPVSSSIDEMIGNEKNIVDKDYIGIGYRGIDIRDFTINKWYKSYWEYHSVPSGYKMIDQRMYVSTNRSPDISRQEPIKDALGLDKHSFDGSIMSRADAQNINKDSDNRDFRESKYYLYIGTKYSGKATADPDAHAPLIDGEVTTDVPGEVSPVAEYVPKNSYINKYVSVKGGDEIDLGRELRDGETPYLVTLDTIRTDGIGKYRLWRAEDKKSNPFNPSDAGTDSTGAAKVIKCSMNGRKLVIGSGEANKEVEYKLFIVNKAASSEPSSNIIKIDNKPPVIQKIQIKFKDVTKDYKEIDAGENLSIKLNEPGYIYMIRTDLYKYGMTKEDLDRIESGSDKKGIGRRVINSKSQKDVSTVNLSLMIADDRTDYVVLASDEAGNIGTEVYDIVIYRNIKGLKTTMIAGSTKVDELNEKVQKLQELVNQNPNDKRYSSNLSNLKIKLNQLNYALRDAENMCKNETASASRVTVTTQRLQTAINNAQSAIDSAQAVQ